MGKVATITTNEGSVVTLSMIKWGVLRRGGLRALPATARQTQFIPRYEVAVYNGSGGLGLKPNLTVFYADEETALKGWDELAKITEGFGLIGLQMFSGAADPRMEAWWFRGGEHIRPWA